MADDLNQRLPTEHNSVRQDAHRRDWTRLDSLSVTLITLAGGILRFVGLGDAKGQMFDEIYYARDACLYAGELPSVCGIDSPENYVHPPLGKWLIAAGIKVFGHNEMGWRVASAVAGTITIALLYLLARKVLRSTLGAGIASGLFAIDFLAFVQSRVSMLDVFVPLFGVASFLFLAYDRDRLAGGPSRSRALRGRGWRLAAGIAAGAATATKWSGVFFVVTAIAITATWEVSARVRDREGHALKRAWSQEGLTVGAWLLLVPLLVYLATYVGRIDGSLIAVPWHADSALYNLVEEHRRALDFHVELEARHPYESPPWSWLLLKRPVAYYVAPDAPEGFIGSITAIGSPLTWWAFLPAIVFTTGAWVRRRDLIRPEGLILTGISFTYLPWLFLSQGRSAVFLFYLLPAVPFMCLTLGYCFVRLGRSVEARVATATFMAGALGLFVFYYPLLVGTVLPYESWERRLLFNDAQACARPQGEPVTTPTETVGDRTRTETNDTTNPDSLPPDGWCWL
ncbi:MAG: phospholipid carrier-dependent glycosyltransferase [Actinomycetota bacterium]